MTIPPIFNSVKFCREMKYLPRNVTISELLDYSWLKNKLKWKRKKRLRKKFLKSYTKYIPDWVIYQYNNMDLYKRLGENISKEVDENILRDRFRPVNMFPQK